MPDGGAALATLATATEATSAAVVLAAAATVAQYAVLAYGLYQSYKASNAKGDPFPGQDVPFRGTDVPKWVVYGRTAPTPGMLYHCVHPSNSNYYSAVFDVAHHEIDAFEDFLLNNESVGPLGDGIWNGETYGPGHPLSGTLVQPGSKWYKTWTESYVQRVTWPAEGETITLDYPVEAYETIALPSGNEGQTGGEPLDGNVGGTGFGHWEGTQTGDEASRTLTVLTSEYEGRPMVITFRKRVGEPLLRIRSFRGLPDGERDTVLEADSGGEWSATDVGAHVARFVLTFKWDMETFGSIPIPDPRAVIRGKRVFNWVAGTTAWSQNGESCALDYLTDPIFGFGVTLGSNDIDMAAAIAGENICAETVSIDDQGGTQARYTADGVLYSNETLFDNFRRLLAAMAGGATHSGGKWIVRPGSYQIPALTLDDEDFARGEKLATPFTSTREDFNSISGRFTDPSNGYRPNAFQPYESATYIAEDGGEKSFREIDLPMVTNGFRARRIAKQVLFRSRNSYTWASTYNMRAYPLQPMDGVYLRHKRRGWHTQNGGAGKSFATVNRRLTANGTVQCKFVEDAPEFHAWNYDEAIGPDPAPNVSLPNPRVVAPLVGFSVFSDANTYRTVSSDSIVPFVRVSWTLIPEQSRPLGGVIEVFYKRAGESSYRKAQVRLDETEYLIEPVSPGETLNISAHVKNSVGAVSAAVFSTHTVSADLPNFVTAQNFANLLFNATGASGLVGWEQGIKGFELSPTIDYVGPPRTDSEALGGKIGLVPSDFLAFQGTMAPGTEIQFRSKFIPVDPAFPYAVMVSALMFNSTGSYGIEQYGGDGTLLETSYPSGSSAFPVRDYDTPDVDRDPTKLSCYTQAGAVVKLNANARRIRFFVSKFANVVNNSTYTFGWMFWTQPLVAKLPLGQVLLPAWNPGGQNGVGADQLEPGAVVRVLEPASPLSDSIMSAGSATLNREVLRFVPTEDGKAEIVLSAEAVSVGSGTPYMLEVGVLARTPPDNLKTSAASANVYATTTSTDPITGSVDRSLTVSVKAGVEVIVYLYANRYSRVVEKALASPTPPPGTDYLRSIKVKATVFKRAI